MTVDGVSLTIGISAAWLSPFQIIKELLGGIIVTKRIDYWTQYDF